MKTKLVFISTILIIIFSIFLIGQNSCDNSNKALLSFALNMVPLKTSSNVSTESVILTRGYFHFKSITFTGTRTTETGHEVSVHAKFIGPYHITFEFGRKCLTSFNIEATTSDGTIDGCGPGPLQDTLESSEGTYKKTEISFEQDNTTYKYIRVEGTVISTKSVPLVLELDLSTEYILTFLNGSAVVSLTTPINNFTLNIDPTLLFSGVNWSEATITNGTYVVNTTINKNILNQFLANLTKYSLLYNDNNQDGYPDK